MKLFSYDLVYGNGDWEDGVIAAETEEKAREKLKRRMQSRWLVGERKLGSGYVQVYREITAETVAAEFADGVYVFTAPGLGTRRSN